MTESYQMLRKELDACFDLIRKWNDTFEDGDEEQQDEIRDEILSIEFSSGWYMAGDRPPLQAQLFCITLTCGGPNIWIEGEFDQYRNPYECKLKGIWGSETITLLDHAGTLYEFVGHLGIGNYD